MKLLSFFKKKKTFNHFKKYYKIIEGTDQHTEYIVDSFIKEGWIPVGGVSVIKKDEGGAMIYAQAIMKGMDDENNQN